MSHSVAVYRVPACAGLIIVMCRHTVAAHVCRTRSASRCVPLQVSGQFALCMPAELLCVSFSNDAATPGLVGKTISRGVPANVGEATAASHFTTAAPSPSPPSAEAATTEETEDGPRVFRWNYRKGATAGLNAAGGATSYETLAEKYGRRKPR